MAYDGEHFEPKANPLWSQPPMLYRAPAPPPYDEAADDLRTLREARDKIHRGWIQGSASDSRGVCLGFALYSSGPRCDMNRLAQRLGFNNSNEIVPWNDSPHRTKADVLKRLDNAIEGREVRPSVEVRYPWAVDRPQYVPTYSGLEF